MKRKLFFTPLRTILFLIVAFLSSCNEDKNDISISGISELSINFKIIQEGVELKNQTLIVNEFIETREYNIWAPSQAAVWLDLRFNFKGISADNQEYSGYIQFASLETNLDKVVLSNDSWKFIDPLDMKNFLNQDLVIILNDSGFNDSNDNESISIVELTNEIFQVNRSFSGSAWRPYMDGIQGYNILEASFNAYLQQ